MATATLNLKISPRRMISAREAAGYCGLPRKSFPILCDVQPVEMPGGTRLYDMHDLDIWIDGMKQGLAANDNDILDRLIT